MSNFLKRTIFGALYVALVITSCLLFNPYYYGIVFLLISIFAVREFHHITHADKFITISGMILAGCLFLTSWLQCKFPAQSSMLAIAYIGLLVLLMVAELFRKSENPISNWGNLLMGQAMVAYPIALMNDLFAYSPMLLLALFVIIWLNDTGAYCVGSLIGKHKMIPRVSPGKTWEGLAGGIVCGMLVGWIFLADPWKFTGLEFSPITAIVLSLVVVIAGTLGDLMESLLKRTLGIKDSGNVLPGHGGFLDRFDSVLLASIALTLSLQLALL
ncbi:MAG: phosphatidate cytidylyltransferase [Paludibacter sp.]|nr:phosphatidate cytidylyltransferase [Bacteroidales bacterium]MCM1068993.1 phosphatidate cytidylyltransferase [Prevotella sp.]MCM1353656.1 phosphatidate cytidylyltransferase [Bacteroides sp.]MCM1441995.1 phosphatidate cytidylyltransferase [Muribaculum sp.]MCM1481549.1 phosphatidate cytidylyltransferase [Paludibacter sp.]